MLYTLIAVSLCSTVLSPEERDLGVEPGAPFLVIDGGQRLVAGLLDAHCPRSTPDSTSTLVHVADVHADGDHLVADVLEVRAGRTVQTILPVTVEPSGLQIPGYLDIASDPVWFNLDGRRLAVHARMSLAGGDCRMVLWLGDDYPAAADQIAHPHEANPSSDYSSLCTLTATPEFLSAMAPLVEGHSFDASGAKITLQGLRATLNGVRGRMEFPLSVSAVGDCLLGIDLAPRSEAFPQATITDVQLKAPAPTAGSLAEEIKAKAARAVVDALGADLSNKYKGTLFFPGGRVRDVVLTIGDHPVNAHIVQSAMLLQPAEGNVGACFRFRGSVVFGPGDDEKR